MLGRGDIGHVVKMHFLKNILLRYPGELLRRTDYKVILMMESFIKIVNLMTPWAGALVLRLGHIGAFFLSRYFHLCGIMETIMSKKAAPKS